MPVERFTTEDGEEEPQEGQRAQSAGEADTGARRGLVRRLVLPAGMAAVLGVAFLAYFLLSGPLGRGSTGPPEGGGTLVPLEAQTVNLAEPGTRLDVRIVFEASSPEFAAVLRERQAQLADIAITVLGTKKPRQLDSELERNRLKRELADAVGQHVRSGDAYITNVYFTRFYYE